MAHEGRPRHIPSALRVALLATQACLLAWLAPSFAWGQAPSLAITNVTQAEGTGGTSDFVFEVTLSAGYGLEVTVDYTTRGSTATSGVDFLPASGTLTFPPGTTSQPIVVQVVGDTDYESAELFYVDLTNAVNATIADSYGFGSIQNDDVRVTIPDVSQAEGTGGTTDFVFNVVLSAAYGLEVTVDYATRSGTATSGVDFLPASGTLTFPPGTTSQPIVVQVIGDTDYENVEYFYVDLTNAVNTTIGDPYGVGHIQNDDVRFTIPDVFQAEGTGGTNGFVFNVGLTAAYGLEVTVDYATRSGTAASGVDFLPASGTLTFPPGTTSQPIVVQVVGDTDYETTEYFYVDLSNAVNATISDAYGVGYVQNDDVRITIPDVIQPEGTGGTTDFVFDVALSGAYGLEVTVDYATRSGTATSGVDFLPASGTLTFPPGTTSQPIVVQVVGDTDYESTEYLYVDLTNAVNATIGDAYGVGHVHDDDVRITIPDVTQAEGTGGTTDFVFDVALSGAYGLEVTVDYATRSGTATSGVDFLPASGMLVFPPGTTSQPIIIQVVGDADVESAENFYVDLANAVNASIGDPYGVGNIQNDDLVPSLSVDDVAAGEGDGGTTPFQFTVSLSGAVSTTVTVGYVTMDGTAIAGEDYAATAGTLTFDPGETSLPVVVQVTGDGIYENDEVFFLRIQNPVNATISDAFGDATIVNDEPPVEISIDDVSGVEGTTGTGDFVFTVSLSGPSSLVTSVSIASTGASASPGIDFASAAPSEMVFAPGEVSRAFVVTCVCDPDYEIDETFVVTLSTPVNALIGKGQGVGTILDDDVACSPEPGHVADLQVAITGGGELYFSWSDLPGSTGYVLYEDGVPNGPALSEAGSAVSGASGITLEMPPGDAFYLLAVSNAVCGTGPRRSCAHDPCAVGGRLDSACGLCVAAICAADPDCCTTGWDADCVGAVAGACGLAGY